MIHQGLLYTDGKLNVRAGTPPDTDPIHRGWRRTKSGVAWVAFSGAVKYRWNGMGFTEEGALLVAFREFASALGAEVGDYVHDGLRFRDGKLLIFEPRTNDALWAEAFDNGAWTKSSTTVSADAVASPDGTTNADKIVEASTTGGVHRISQVVTATADATYSVSVFLKAAERTWARIRIVNGANAFLAYYDLSSGATGTTTAAGTGAVSSADIEEYPNGWYRCSVIGSVGSSATAITMELTLAEANNDITYDGDGTSGIYAWGAQFENNVSAPSSYIKTEGTAVSSSEQSGIFGGKRITDSNSLVVTFA